MHFDKAEYGKKVEQMANCSPWHKNLFAAFWVGGLICTVAEGVFLWLSYLGVEQQLAGLMITVGLIFLSALMTALGVYDRLARYAGAGTLVPVTGFANAVVSPAIDTKKEGLVMGVGAKIFTVAGPVLLYACFSGAIYGVIYAIFR